MSVFERRISRPSKDGDFTCVWIQEGPGREMMVHFEYAVNHPRAKRPMEGRFAVEVSQFRQGKGDLEALKENKFRKSGYVRLNSLFHLPVTEEDRELHQKLFEEVDQFLEEHGK